jgi:hypothetical protein
VQHGRQDRDGDDFAEIWRNAQHRRSYEVCFWLTNTFKRLWQLRSPDRRVWLLFPPYARNRFFLPEAERPALKGGTETNGGRSGQ